MQINEIHETTHDTVSTNDTPLETNDERLDMQHDGLSSPLDLQDTTPISTTTPIENSVTMVPQSLQNNYDSSVQKAPLQAIFEFGMPGSHLLFSEPVTLSYEVPYPE